MTFRRSFLSDVNPLLIDMDKVKYSIENKIDLINSYQSKKTKRANSSFENLATYTNKNITSKVFKKPISSSNLDHNVIANRAVKKSKIIDLVSPNLRNSLNKFDKVSVNKTKRLNALAKKSNNKFKTIVSSSENLKPNSNLEANSLSDIKSKSLNNRNTVSKSYSINNELPKISFGSLNKNFLDKVAKYYENDPLSIDTQKSLQQTKKLNNLDKFIHHDEIKSSALDNVIDNDNKKEDKIQVDNLTDYFVPSPSVEQQLSSDKNFDDIYKKLSLLKNMVLEKTEQPASEMQKSNDLQSSDMNKTSYLENRLISLEDKLTELLESQNEKCKDNVEVSKKFHDAATHCELDDIANSIENIHKELIKIPEQNIHTHLLQSKNNFITKEEYQFNDILSKISNLEALNNKNLFDINSKETSLRLQQIENQILHDKIVKSVLLTQDIENLKNSQQGIKNVLDNNGDFFIKPAANTTHPDIKVSDKSIDNGLLQKIENLEKILSEININISSKKEDIALDIMSEQINDLSMDIKRLAGANEDDIVNIKSSVESIESSLEDLLQICSSQIESTNLLSHKIRNSIEEIKKDSYVNKNEIVEDLSNSIFIQLKQFEQYFDNIYNKLSNQVSFVDNASSKHDKGKLKISSQRIFSILKDVTNMQKLNLQEIVMLRNNVSSKNTISYNKLNNCAKTINAVQKNIEDYIIKNDNIIENVKIIDKSKSISQKNNKIIKNCLSSKVKSKEIDVNQNMVYLETILKNNLKESVNKN